MNEGGPICENCWLGDAGECPPGQTCAAYDLISKLKGKEIFNSHYYKGECGRSTLGNIWEAKLYFNDIDDYSDFLNWWVLGQLSKARGEVMRGLATAKAPLSPEEEPEVHPSIESQEKAYEEQQKEDE